ncbi:excinuclease ABC subunit UvrC [Patescibacteria group bacterium]|nr:excinuclease ABC subunit UvrC [Patescibacteria group bacterium]
MKQSLLRQINTLPKKPGVYIFYSSQNKPLYVGKAKNLQTRVRSYFQSQTNLSPAKKIMVEQIIKIRISPVKNELEALLLEANLIKQHQPAYNVVLKDDKSWLYLAINYKEKLPTVSLTRQTNQPGIKYFGPYPSAGSIKNTLNLLKKMLGLKTCTNPPDKPCFAAKLNRCLGHDDSPSGKKFYLEQLKKLEAILKGQTNNLIKNTQQNMLKAGQQQQYEKAGKLRNQLIALEKISQKQNIVSGRPENLEIINLAQNQNQIAVCLLPVRQGILLDAKNFLISSQAQLTSAELLEGFLNQYLKPGNDFAKQIITPVQLENNYPEIRLIVPQKGYKKQLLKQAADTAENYLKQNLVSWQKKNEQAQLGLQQLQRILNLKKIPLRIEGYDISNLQGKQAVGAMTVLQNGLPEPKLYRRFTIENINRPNDYAMLAQVLARRLSRNKNWPRPDLIMLDGGAGQLSAVKKILLAQKINIPLIALAKQNEELYLPNHKKPLNLPLDNPGLKLLINLRDEAHRFGLNLHRQQRSKAQIISQWDELPNIGPKLKKKLKQSFASVMEIKQSDISLLIKIIGQNRAKKLKTYLEDNY